MLGWNRYDKYSGGTNMLRRLLGFDKKENRKTKEIKSVDELLDQLPEDVRVSAVATAARKGLTKKQENVETAIEFYVERGYPKSTAAKVALQVGDYERAMKLELTGWDPCDIADIAIEYDAVNLGIELLEPLLEGPELSFNGKELVRDKLVELYDVKGDSKKADSFYQIKIDKMIQEGNVDRAFELSNERFGEEKAVEASIAAAEKVERTGSLLMASEFIRKYDSNKADELFLKGLDKFYSDKGIDRLSIELFNFRSEKSFEQLINEFSDKERLIPILEKAGKYNMAGEFSEICGDMDRAIANYEKGEQYEKAGQLLKNKGKYGKAMVNFHKGYERYKEAETALEWGHPMALRRATKICDNGGEKYLKLGYTISKKLGDYELADKFCKQGMRNYAERGKFNVCAEFAGMMGDEQLASVYRKLGKMCK